MRGAKQKSPSPGNLYRQGGGFLVEYEYEFSQKHPN